MPRIPAQKRSAPGLHSSERAAPRPPRGAWTRFVDRYGWRAYALPVLTIVTIAALAHGNAADARQEHTAAGSSRKPSTTTTDAGRGSAASRVRTRVDGAGGAGFSAASTPAPVVINLKSDAVTSCATNTYDQLILVSISKQRMWACDRSKQVNESPVTTGKVVDHDQTPIGSWRVQAKQRDRYLVGPGYRDYVHYWVPFNGDFGLHDAPWQTMPFGSKHWPTRGSHGCVHVPTKVMAWLYHWAGVGSTVVTVEQ